MIVLPRTFKPTHPTGGLDGYPAIDVFGQAGTKIGAPAGGKIRRKSGKSPAQGGRPGGAYGWSLYLAADNGDDYYLTHFAMVTVGPGDRVARGDVIGTICDSAVSGKPNTSHIHEGLKKAKKPIPVPPARLFHVFDRTGKQRASRKTPAQIAKAMESLEKRFGPLTIKRA